MAVTIKDLYTQYGPHPRFAERARLIRERYPDARTVLVVGCARGYLIEALLELGLDAWGCDIEPESVPEAVADRVIQAGATEPDELDAVRRAAGLKGSRKFDLAVTEDVLPCLDDPGARRLLEAVRAVAKGRLHIVTPGDPTDPAKLPGLNWKPIETWRTLVGGETVLDAESGELR